MLNLYFELTESTLMQQMTIKVVWFCTSSSNPNEQSSANLYALNLLRPLKGERIEGEATIPITGKTGVSAIQPWIRRPTGSAKWSPAISNVRF